MNEKILALQVWLNIKGAAPRLVEDGKRGPATRRAVIETFRNTAASAITIPERIAFADRVGCTPRQLETIARTESNGGGWDNSGLLKLLWERHYLWRRVKVSIPLLSNPKPDPKEYTIDANRNGINDSWEKLADASMQFGFGIAAECASFGKFQVMGAWWKDLGYSSPAEMIWLLSRDEAAHYDLLCRYIEKNKLQSAAQAISGNPPDCLPFARGYNGPAQKGYDVRLANNFRRLA